LYRRNNTFGLIFAKGAQDISARSTSIKDRLAIRALFRPMGRHSRLVNSSDKRPNKQTKEIERRGVIAVAARQPLSPMRGTP
jgi:hypothetical protein